jgi:hypothetical protein
MGIAYQYNTPGFAGRIIPQSGEHDTSSLPLELMFVIDIQNRFSYTFIIRGVISYKTI